MLLSFNKPLLRLPQRFVIYYKCCHYFSMISKPAKSLARRMKFLAIFNPPLNFEFRLYWGRPCLTESIKIIQLSSGFNIIDCTHPYISGVIMIFFNYARLPRWVRTKATPNWLPNLGDVWMLLGYSLRDSEALSCFHSFVFVFVFVSSQPINISLELKYIRNNKISLGNEKQN